MRRACSFVLFGRPERLSRWIGFRWVYCAMA